jgi:DNA polymerase III delta subunit
MAKPVYALVGCDSFLQLQELAKITREMGADAQRSDYDGETAQLAEVLDDLRCYSMFGGCGKLVVIRNADAFITRFREQLEDYVSAPSDSGTLVLRLSSLPATQRIHKAIAKTGQIISCDPPKDLAKWAIEHAKTSQKVTLALDAARMLADLVGDDLGRLDMEIAKLAIQADGGKITAETVSMNVAFTREREMWDLTNAVASGNTAEALRRWRQMVQADASTEFRAVTWLGIWLGDVRQIRRQRHVARQGRLRPCAGSVDGDRSAKQVRRRRRRDKCRALHPRPLTCNGTLTGAYHSHASSIVLANFPAACPLGRLREFWTRQRARCRFDDLYEPSSHSNC